MKFVVAAAIASACSSSQPPAPPATAPVASHATQPVVDHDAGRQDLDLPGDANGLYWDAGEHTLYLTDATHDTLVAWTDAKGFAEVVALPPGPKLELGGLARLTDGTFVIASFGFGTDGGVVVVDASHHVSTVPNLDKTRRRIGIARGPDNVLYDAYFVVNGHEHTGGVAKLDLATGETDVVTKGLAKAVGIAATASGIYVSDQETNTIFKVQAGDVKPLATGLASADLLTVLPDHSLVTGGKTGAVVRIKLDGTQSQIAAGFDQVRGTAYDPDGKRLFVVEHSKASQNHKLHIIPFTP